MSTHDHFSSARRLVMKSLVALPVTAAFPVGAESTDSPGLQPTLPKLEEVLSIAEFEALAHAVLPPAHFGYLATGVDDDRTVAWNHEAFSLLEIRSRRSSM